MCGRTHGQPGLPITFGFKAAVWAAELDRHLERLRQGRARWEVVQLGGALGSMEFWGERALDLLQGFARELGLGVPVVPWITARDGVAEFIWLLAAISATAGKIGNEVYQLQRPEIGELREVVHPGHGRLDHDAAQAQPGDLRAPGHPVPGDPGPGRAGPGRDDWPSTSGTAGPGRPSGWWCPETGMAFAACVGPAAQDAGRAAGRPGADARPTSAATGLPAVRTGDARAGRPARQALGA